MIQQEGYQSLISTTTAANAVLVAVSKTKPGEDVLALYELGQRDFGENYVQELAEKAAHLPKDIRWHFIGHLQTNKVRFIAPFVHLIHGVDSFRLLQEINKQALKAGRIIDVLLQVFIAEEDTKFGLDEREIFELLEYYEAQQATLQHIRICGLMGLASATDDAAVIRKEFARLRALFDNLRQVQFLGKPHFSILSMGMSGDYRIALEEGSTMLRVGSLLFGSR